MAIEYDAFVEDPEKLPKVGEKELEMALTLRELTPRDPKQKYNSRFVHALISKDRDRFPEANVLWVRYERGELYPEHWYIKIVEELGPFRVKKAEVRT